MIKRRLSPDAEAAFVCVAGKKSFARNVEKMSREIK
jgi:hypothetical protein